MGEGGGMSVTNPGFPMMVSVKIYTIYIC